VIAKDLFNSFKIKGLDNPEIAYVYRQKILEPGGSRDAADLVKDFLGRDFSFEAYRQFVSSESM
jgi:thimet oligopeptidase